MQLHCPNEMNPAPIKVSIVIPVYNVEEYLDKCLNSIYSQTLAGDQFEVICVDDGSTDSSPAILADFATRNANLRVIRQENAGSSVARNRGLDTAHGEYVYFMDSDDWLCRPDALELLCERAEQLVLDELIFNARVSYESDDLINSTSTQYGHFNADYPNDFVLSGQDMFVFLQKNRDYYPVIWRRFYRREFLNENELRFIPGILHQDNAFTVECMALAKRVACWDFCCYNHFLRANSVMTNKSKHPCRSIASRLIGVAQMREFARLRLADASPAFLRTYATFVDNWEKYNAQEYVHLSRRQQKEFWNSVSPEVRSQSERKMRRLGHQIRYAKFKHRARRAIPKPLCDAIKAIVAIFSRKNNSTPL